MDNPLVIGALIIGGLYLWSTMTASGPTTGAPPPVPTGGPGGMLPPGGNYQNPGAAPPDQMPPVIASGASPNGIYSIPGGGIYYGAPPPRPGEAPAPSTITPAPGGAKGASPAKPRVPPPITATVGGDQSHGGTNSTGNLYTNSRSGNTGAALLVGGIHKGGNAPGFQPPPPPGGYRTPKPAKPPPKSRT